MTRPPTGGNDRPGSRHSRFLERLRARPLSSWNQGDRYRAARRAAAELADLGWQAERRTPPAPPVPDLGAHALADQLAVLLADAERAGADPELVDDVVGELADQLGIRRG